MSKKLLMNNYSEKDEIILCENYTPTNAPVYLWQDRKIDFDDYELYINLDIADNTFSSWASALIISSMNDIGSWGSFGNNGKIHVYYTANTIRLQPVSGECGSQEADKSLIHYNKKKIQLIINKNGIYLENQLIMSSHHSLQAVMKCLKTSNASIIGIRTVGCTYNKISLRKYQERG